VDPATIFGGALVLLGVGLAVTCFAAGRWTTTYERDRLRDDLAQIHAALESALAASSARAHGAQDDLARAVGLAAADDLDGVLRHFAESRPDPAALEPTDEADA